MTDATDSRTLQQVRYKVVSADSHVIEPHDLWQTYMDRDFVSRAPRLIHQADTDVLEFAEIQMPPIGLLGGAARRDEHVRREGRWESDIMKGAYDPEARLADTERDGVDAEVLFPTLSMHFYPIEETEFQWALFRAFNTWLADFVSTHPERYKGIGMLNHEDVTGAEEELQRCRSLGLSGVMIPLYAGDAVRYSDRRLDPLWARAVDLDMPINLHVATSRSRQKAKQSWTGGASLTALTLRPYDIQATLLDMIFHGVFDRFPALKVVSVENEAGWASSMVESADYIWKRSRKLKKDETCLRPPSHYFPENIRITFMRDQTAIATRDLIGVESLMWSNDYPHHDSIWPHSQEIIGQQLRDVAPDAQRKILCENVRKLYGF